MAVCPRCKDEHISTLAESPVANVWTLFQCDRCLYTWRSTEPLRRSHHEHYPQAFRMAPEDLDHAEEIPAVPPLVTKS